MDERGWTRIQKPIAPGIHSRKAAGKNSAENEDFFEMAPKNLNRKTKQTEKKLELDKAAVKGHVPYMEGRVLKLGMRAGRTEWETKWGDGALQPGEQSGQPMARRPGRKLEKLKEKLKHLDR